MARTQVQSTTHNHRWLLATSLAAAIGMAPMTFAAPPVVPSNDKKPKIVISPARPATGAASANVAAAKAPATAKAPAKSAAKPATKAPAKSNTKTSTKSSSQSGKSSNKSTNSSSNSASSNSSSSNSSSNQSNQSSGSSGGAQQAQAAVAVVPPKPLTILVNLNPSQYFNASMQNQNVEELLVLYPNNFDASSQQTAKVDGQKVVAAVKAAKGENPSGWVMLDYEVPFDSIFWNGKTDPRFNGMVASMIEAIQYAKAELPNCKFTYYGVPNVRYYVADKGWNNMPDWAKIQTRQECMDVYLSIVKEMDWISPCLYDRFDPAMHEESERASLAARESAFRLNAVQICDMLRDAAGKPDLPIIPSICVVYSDHGKATVWDPIKGEEFRSDQVDPSLMAGADGFFLWSSLEYNAWVAGLSWVPTPGEQPRADARSTLTKLFYDGVAPSSWTSTDSKTETSRRISEFMAKYAKWVRDAEKSVARPTAVASGPNG
jgi:hypothetical protein